uniref:SAUR family protein n=1 Tax=Kalanchoe fedtschenkoi TaxID=63787 RepID=A0A7N0TWE4_KALFE
MDESLLSDSKMDSKKVNKIGEIIKLQRILKKCRKLADSFENNSSNSNSKSNSSSNNSSKGSNKRTKFLKRTLSFTDNSSIAGESRSGTVPKGYLAICVGKDMKKFIIPTEYLSHEAFKILLREAEEEFGFQQEGVLRLPCDECVFEDVLKSIQRKPCTKLKHQSRTGVANGNGSCSLESQLSQGPHAHIQPCR